MTWPIRKQSQWQGQGQIHFMNREPEFAKITVNCQLRVRVTLDSIRSSCDVLSWFRLIMVSLIIIWCYSPITPFSGPSQRSWPSLFTFGGCLSSFKFLISFFTLIDLYTIYIYSASLILIGGTIENIHLNFPNSEGGGNPIWKISKKWSIIARTTIFHLIQPGTHVCEDVSQPYHNNVDKDLRTMIRSDHINGQCITK